MMADSAKQPEPAVGASSAPGAKDATISAPTSPARSDKSSDSEGKPVRDKLKETRIDAQGAAEPTAGADQHMEGAVNGSEKVGENNTSGSDSDGARLGRKRSREAFEEEQEPDKHPDKKHEKSERHHVRKRSRDVKDIESGMPLKPPKASVARIEENDGDEHMTSPSKDTSKAVAATASTATDNSPKNKRTRDQAEENPVPTTESAIEPTTNGKLASKAEDEREAKRPRDKEDVKAAASTAKIPPGSGFANFSAASPFAAMSPKPNSSKTTDRLELQPQTSDDKFQKSSFATLAKSSSPFGGVASPGSQSPFGAASGKKLGSFAGSTAAPAAPLSGFGSLGASSKSAFGGSTFGSSLGGGFGAISGSKSALTSFETPADLTIKGLKSKTTAFGTPGNDKETEDSDDEEGSDPENDDEDRRTSQPLLSQQPQETGEEGEISVWQGRAKLYTMAVEGNTKAWKERGVGTFKFNVTVDEPKKARFVLRADGTHRLLLNAGVTQQLVFGGNSSGEKPKDGKLLFNTPTPDGELEMHLLKLKAEFAVKLWEEVSKVQELEL